MLSKVLFDNSQSFGDAPFHILIFLFYRHGNGASIFTTSGVAARKFQNEVEAGLVSQPFCMAYRYQELLVPLFPAIGSAQFKPILDRIQGPIYGLVVQNLNKKLDWLTCYIVEEAVICKCCIYVYD